MNFKLNFLIVFSLFIFQHPIAAQKNKKNKERYNLAVENDNNILTFERTRVQKVGSGGRGLVSSFILAKGIQGVQSLIDNHKKRFTTSYSFATRDESFYSQISTLGAFDPIGIRFKSFSVFRLVQNKEGVVDTAFIAKFRIDTSGEKINEIMNNGIFRLRLEYFKLQAAKVKTPNAKKILNMDFDISFVSSFIAENGQINSDVPVGKFVFSIRNAPLRKDDDQYAIYYDSLNKKQPFCTGQCFLIPRSCGYFRTEDQNISKCYGQGLYSIKVDVKESSKNSFIDKIIIYSTDDIMSAGKSILQKKYGTFPATTTPAKPVTPAK